MACSVASKGVPLSSLMEKLFSEPGAPGGVRVVGPVPLAGGARLLNTSAPLHHHDSDDGILRDYDAINNGHRVHHFAVPGFYSDVLLDPFGPPKAKSSTPLMNLADDYPTSCRAAPPRRRWYAKDDGEALHLRVDMPGLGKEHVKVWAEKNILVINGEGEKGAEEDEPSRRYNDRVELPPEVFKMDKIKAEMKNGVLKVVVPKVEEEHKSKFHVTVE